MRRCAVCRSSFDTSSVIDATTTTSLRCVFPARLCQNSHFTSSSEARDCGVSPATMCGFAAFKTILRCDNVPVEFISAWPWFIYSSEHRLAVAGNLTEMHSSAEGALHMQQGQKRVCVSPCFFEQNGASFLVMYSDGESSCAAF